MTIEAAVRAYLIDDLLSGRPDCGELQEDTELVHSGLLDSINVLELVNFLEDSYGVEFGPRDVQGFTSIGEIARIVREKAA